MSQCINISSLIGLISKQWKENLIDKDSVFLYFEANKVIKSIRMSERSPSDVQF